jgi:dihydroceramidase
MYKYYWGNNTALIDFCEKNYDITIYIAEFFNTISNIVIILLALYGFKHSINNDFNYIFSIQYLSIVFVGIGSSLFHCTLRYTEQQLDEIPMMIGLFIWLYIIYKKEWIKYILLQKYLYIFLIKLCILYSILHIKYSFVTIFQITFALLVILSIYRIYKYNKSINSNELKYIVKLYLYSAIIGAMCWLLDYHFCDLINKLPFNLQLHAFWHILSGINVYLGPVFMQYIRAKEEHKNPKIEYNCLNIPYIVIQK